MKTLFVLRYKIGCALLYTTEVHGLSTHSASNIWTKDGILHLSHHPKHMTFYKKEIIILHIIIYRVLYCNINTILRHQTYDMYCDITIRRVSQLSTDHTSIIIIPEITTHCTPCSINTYFNTTWSGRWSLRQPNSSIDTFSYRSYRQ